MDLAINNAWVVDFEKLDFNRLSIGIKGGLIARISQNPIKAKEVIEADGLYLSTGLIDCHCHIESTHLTPKGFAEAVVEKGTLFAVADCHEIANVFGRKGLEFFINDAKDTEMQLKFALPSCVPATEFATSGGKIDLEDVKYFLGFDDVVSLGELMNVPGVVNRDEKFMKMIELAKRKNKRINGHAPHLDVQTLKLYKEAGVEDDHESYDYDELKQKIELGFFVFLREGSSEHSTDDAYKIIKEHPDKVAFCSDDKSVGDILEKGHIDYNLRKAISLGINPALALKVASFNGLKYYGLDEFLGIKKGKRAYLVLFDDKFRPKISITDGKIYKSTHKKSKPPKEFLNSIKVKTPIELPKIKHKNIAIGLENGSLITQKLSIERQEKEFSIKDDILKLVVIERYGHNNKAACFVKGFSLKKGAMATSLAHDCHNIVAVGTSDEKIKTAILTIMEMQGGQVVVDGDKITRLALPIGGIVSNDGAKDIKESVIALKQAAKELGCKLDDPLGMLSFLALEVIPHIKLTDKGLFDVDKFCYIEENL
ncbi:adenine deaminase [Hippea maritima]|uniref:Adenine deaminase n=1 Tax=Hippea maritima (strain ATCC 700847 / DSM 10411 / MH2) TaxID=760142 RepID=F2LUQ8_HIPMA|nr:adenine deaminase [Hippea maritima]AEA33513.1 Adenine deaminase [Hippea maritima DSM 10411]